MIKIQHKRYVDGCKRFDVEMKELKALMNIMDKNKDGKVSWEEFLEVMKDWLADTKESKKKRRRSLHEVCFHVDGCIICVVKRRIAQENFKVFLAI